MTTGGRIRQLRLENELTQKQLALKLGVEAITVSRWERDQSPPSPINRAKLSRVFQVSPAQFIDTSINIEAVA